MCWAISPRTSARGSTALCDVIADNAELLAQGKDASFQNKVHLAMDAQGLWTGERDS